MDKKLCPSLAVLFMSALLAPSALGATITLNPTCSFAKAVEWINTGTAQSGCTRSGTLGINDTIVVGLNHQEFTINDTVEIKKSLTVQSWSSYGTLKTTNPSTTNAIVIAEKDILVRFTAIILRGVTNNQTTGFYVVGSNDTESSFTAKLILGSSRITGFRRSGIYIYEGGVDMSSTTLDDNSNTGVGGAVRIETVTKFGRLNAFDCLFSGNSARHGGAIYNHGVLNVTFGHFYDNVAHTGINSGSGGVVFAEHSAVNYYTAFAGGGYFENNRADTNGYAITGGATTEFAGDPSSFEANGNTSGTINPPRLCENPSGSAGCPTQ